MKDLGVLIKEKNKETYTGRKNEIKLFFKTLENKEWNESRLLSYYGVGGIGKTELRREIMKRLKGTSEADFTYINFESKELQQAEKALVHLRTEIAKEYRVPFTLFDAAYLIYMKKSNQSFSFNESTFPFGQEGSWVVEAYSTIANHPYVALGSKLVEIISNRLKNRFSKDDKALIEAFDDMEFRELLGYLPVIFAYDLKKYLEKADQTFVIFLDTYEALWTDQRMKAYEFSVDEWVRELVEQLPNVLWVVFGREAVDWGSYKDKDKWNDIIIQVPLGALTDMETKELLKKHGIFDEAIQDEIYRNTKGHPYSIKLAYDTYTNIAKSHQPTVSDFMGIKTPVELFERFVIYLLKHELQALELLALTNSWDIETYKELMLHFNIQMNTADHYHLTRFSFITELEDGRWEMHQLMRESLIDHQPAENVILGRAFLFDFFKAKLSKDMVKKDPLDASKIINQAFYHGYMLMEQERVTLSCFIDWFRDYDIVFLKSKANYLTVPLLNQLKNFLESKSQSEAEKYLGIILYDIAYIYMDENRDYEKAEPLFKEVMELRERKFPEDKLSLAKSYYGLATLYQRMGRNAEAEELHLKAFHLREQYCDQSNLVALAFSSNGLALLYQNLKDYEKAQNFYGNSLKIYETLNKSDYANITTTMMNLISCYHELRQYDKAYEFSIKVREIIETEGNLKTINYAKALNVLGITKTAMSQYEDALELLQNSYDIFNIRLGEESLEVSKVLHNLALTHALLKNQNDSMDKLKKCLEIKQMLISKKKLSEANLNYLSTQEMHQLLNQDLFEYDQLKFNF